ncbi:hypothetical protein K7432_003756 [Basidiobolus ranarum]|uniref:Yeast cell wall synthesis Kre9/Knh1-like N-terminal domain-containing protein n=1 Tax=Basidiobolus ranarum TaxID=34480 RepID=A0ABR2WZA0_9FUNG
MVYITKVAFISVFFFKQILVEASLAFTAPILAMWDVGTTQLVTWTDNSDNTPMPATISLTLMNGPAVTLQVVGLIASNIPSATGRFEWAIPANLPTGQYSIRATGGTVLPAYSPFFNIVLSGGSKPDLSPPMLPNTISSTPAIPAISTNPKSPSGLTTNPSAAQSRSSTSSAGTKGISKAPAPASPAPASASSEAEPNSPTESNAVILGLFSTQHLSLVLVTIGFQWVFYWL